MRLLYSEDELERLDLVSVYTERVYRHLRGRMDLKTRIAGRGLGVISRGMLAVCCQYIPPLGSHNKPWKPTLYQVDALIDELVRVGLVVRQALPSERKKLVLFFPLALVRVNEEPYMNPIDERHMSTTRETQYPQGFDASHAADEPDMPPANEPDISLFLCSDEMCAPVCGSGEGPAVDAYEVDRPAESTAWQTTLHAFKQALGADYRTDTQVFKAIAELKAAADVRVVDASEMVSAIAVARSKSAGSVAGYAAAIIRSGSLCPRPGRAATAARAKAAPDPVMAYFDDLTGATV